MRSSSPNPKRDRESDVNDNSTQSSATSASETTEKPKTDLKRTKLNDPSDRPDSSCASTPTAAPLSVETSPSLLATESVESALESTLNTRSNRSVSRRSPRSSPPTAGGKSPSSGNRKSDKEAWYSDIEVGILEGHGLERTLEVEEEFFDGKRLTVYAAVSDPLRKRLFKATDVAKKYNVTNNRLAMYLSRRKTLPNSGIYQADDFVFKKPPRKDLKHGGYFLSVEACKTFGDYVKTQDDNNNAKRPKRRKAGIGASEIVMSSTSAAPIMGNVQNCSPSLIPFAMTQQVHSPPITQMQQQQQQQQQQHHQQMQQDLFHKQHHTGSPLLSKAHNFMSAASNLSSLAQVAVPQNTHMYMLTPMMQKFITEKSVYGHQGTIAHSQPQMQQQGQQSPQQSFMYGQTQAQAQFSPFMPMVLSSVSGTPVGSRHSSTVTQSYMIPSQLPMQLQQQPNQPQAQNLFHPSAAANYLSASQLMQSPSTNMNGGTQ